MKVLITKTPLKYRIHNLLIKLKIPICHGVYGPCFKIGKKRRQNTEYVNKEDNYKFFCKDCQELSDKYWDGMWKDHFNEVL